MKLSYYILFDRIEVQGANAISSPITYGFPAISGFAGAVHALSRRIPQEWEICLDGVLIACHDCRVQAFRPHNFADYTFNQSRNPLKKNGETAAIIEEGKVNLIVSLAVEVTTSDSAFRLLRDSPNDFLTFIRKQIFLQRIAGGSVTAVRGVSLFDKSRINDIKHHLLPAFVLIEAKQDLIEITNELRQENPQATALDALLKTATLHHKPQTDDKGNVNWRTYSVNTGRGWLVPIPVGFQGIAEVFEPGQLANCRSPDYSSQYVECLYSLGKWVFPYRITDLTTGFWRYNNSHNNLYLLTQTV